MKKIIDPELRSQSEVAEIVANLRAAVNALRLKSVRIRVLILDLAAIEENNAAIYVVFNDGSFQFAYSDNVEV